MTEVASAYISLLPTMRGADKAIDAEVGPQLDASGKTGGKRYGKALGGSASSALKSAIGPALAVLGTAGITSLISGSIEEAREAQKVGALTNNVIKQTGGVANVSATQVGNLATAISLKTGMDDEAIQSGANLLLTFKNVRNEAGAGSKIFDRATQAATDLSASGFGDLAGASKQLGKALNDPVKGVAALGRSGVTFSESQKKQIKAMVKNNDLLGAQKIVLAEVESRVGGAAAATATDGEKAAVAVGNLKEQIGTALLPVVDTLATSLTSDVVPALSLVVSNMDTIGPVVGVVAAGLLTYAAASKAVAIATAIQAAGTAGATGATWSLNTALRANPLGIVITALTLLGVGLVLAWKKSETFRTIVIGAFDAVKTGVQKVGEIFRGIYNGFIGPVFSFILKGLGVVLTGFSKLLAGMSKVPGFGWAKDASKALGLAADGAGSLADKIKQIPPAKPKVDAKQITAATTAAGRLGRGLDVVGKKHAKPKTSTPGLGGALDNVSTLGRRLEVVGKKHAKPQVSITGINGALTTIGSLGRQLDSLARKNAKIKVGNNAMGTNNWRGGLTWVGEQGPELINLQKGAQVIPNHRIGQVVGTPAAMTSGHSSGVTAFSDEQFDRLVAAIYDNADSAANGVVDNSLGFGGQLSRMERG